MTGWQYFIGGESGKVKAESRKRKAGSEKPKRQDKLLTRFLIFIPGLKSLGSATHKKYSPPADKIPFKKP